MAAAAPELEVPDQVALLRRSFASGKSHSRQWRVQQLKQFLKLVQIHKDEILAALQADLHKSVHEGWLTELSFVELDIKYTLAHLDDWMQPTQVSNNLLNFPGSSWIYHDPLGVVLLIGAWNYPVQLSLLPLVGAIAGGNCTLLKLPSDKYSQHTSATMARLIPKYLDQECIQVVEGDRQATQAVLQERYDLIFYTGGAYVGKMVAESAAQHLTPTILELGGKSPCIVDKSASLEVSAKRVAWGAFLNAGQTCIRPDYVMVHEEVADRFLEEVRKAVTSMYGANEAELRGTEFYGRLINGRAWERVRDLIQADRERVVIGGELGSAEDRFVGPTVIDFGSDLERFSNAPCMQEEIFGPIMPVYRWRDLDQVIQFIKAREKPLAMYTFAESSKVAKRVLEETYSGSSHINDTMMFMTNHDLPFGGVGQSGMGRYHGKATFEAFTHPKSVTKRSTRLDVWARYPPYDQLKKRAVNAVLGASLSRGQARLLQLSALAVFLALFRKTSAAEAVRSGLVWALTMILG